MSHWQVGAPGQRDPERIKAAIRRMKEIAAGQTLGGDWREFGDAGRKW